MSENHSAPADPRLPYTVLGATGGQGGAVFEALVQRRMPTRAVVRDATSARARRLAEQGAALVEADISNVDQLSSAFRSTAGVFAMTTPFEEGAEAELAQGRAIITAAEQAAVPHLVFSSVASADRDTGIPHFETKAATERLLAASGIPHTVVGPTYFYDNMLAGFDDVLAGRLDLAIGVDTPLQQLSRRDLGRFVVAVLAQPAAFTGARIDLASDSPTPNEMATVLSRMSGQPITAHSHDPAEIANADMRAMFQFLDGGGYRADIAALRRDYPEIGWQSFQEWATDVFAGRR